MLVAWFGLSYEEEIRRENPRARGSGENGWSEVDRFQRKGDGRALPAWFLGKALERRDREPTCVLVR